MQVFYSSYSLTPLKRLNRNSTMEPKPGVHLKAVQGDRVGFADYFPHVVFGDKGCEHFLNEFKQQKDEYDRKVFHLLTRDPDYQNITPRKFFNHQLWTGTEDLEAPVIKYKLSNTTDRTFMDPLKRGIRLRLDANAQFNLKSFQEFLQTIPHELLQLIDYVEDPLLHPHWEDLGIKVATDLIKETQSDVCIFRPNSQFFPEHKIKNIFSSYLGSDLGRWHSYCELMEKGDLNEIHGIMSRGFFVESTCFMQGNYLDGFIADKTIVKKMYQELEKKEWIPLCKF